MSQIELFYATNRAHKGKFRDKPKGYGAEPSSDGGENLRFGSVTLKNIDTKKEQGFLNAKLDYGVGNGVKLSDYYLSKMKSELSMHLRMVWIRIYLILYKMPVN